MQFFGGHDREYRARARILSGIGSGARDAGNTPNSHTVCSMGYPMPVYNQAVEIEGIRARGFTDAELIPQDLFGAIWPVRSTSTPVPSIPQHGPCKPRR